MTSIRRTAHARLRAAVLMLLPGCAVWAQEPPAEAPIVEVAVVGQHKGPQLWRVTSGDHVAWVLGTMQPLPRRMIWDATEVDKVLGEVQEVIPEDVRLEVDAGFLPSLRLYFQWQRVQELKHGQTLRQVLPADLYARLASLRDRYGHGPTDLERLQPLLAADHLKVEAVQKVGLSTGTDVQAMVLKLARKHHVPVRELTLTVGDARRVVKDTGDLPIEAQSPCLDRTVSTLEKDLDVLRTRASAWALGDVATLRSIPPVASGGSCWLAAARAARPDVGRQVHQLWFDAVRQALSTHPATLVIGDIDALLGTHGSQGALAELQTAGYAIEGPAFGDPAR